MTNREILLATRAIVADGDEERNRPGCLEDGLCRTVTGEKWHDKHADGDEFHTQLQKHPVYLMLLREARKQMPWVHCLYNYNDSYRTTKKDRLALIDRVIDSL